MGNEHAPRLVLAALFVTALVTAQLLAVKILSLSLPVSLPAIGDEIIVPAGVLAYAITFVATDCYGELYGKRSAHLLVNIGFAMIFVMLSLLWLAILAPGSPAGVDPGLFAQVLAPSTNIVLGGLLAYLVSQNWDVLVFHRLKSHTDGARLWMRNLGSTASSQLIDTIIFILVAFSIAPSMLEIGVALPFEELVALIVGQYLIKLLIALADTPVVYAVVGLVRRRENQSAATPAD